MMKRTKTTRPIFLAVISILAVLMVQLFHESTSNYVKEEIRHTKYTLQEVKEFHQYISDILKNETLSPQYRFKADKYITPVQNAGEDAIKAVNLYLNSLKKLTDFLAINHHQIVGAAVIVFAILTLFVPTPFTKGLLFLFLIAISLAPLSILIDYFINSLHFNPKIDGYLEELSRYFIKDDVNTVIDSFKYSSVQATATLLGLSKTFLIKAAVNFLVVPFIIFIIFKKIF